MRIKLYNDITFFIEHYYAMHVLPLARYILDLERKLVFSKATAHFAFQFLLAILSSKMNIPWKKQFSSCKTKIRFLFV